MKEGSKESYPDADKIPDPIVKWTNLFFSSSKKRRYKADDRLRINGAIIVNSNQPAATRNICRIAGSEPTIAAPRHCLIAPPVKAFYTVNKAPAAS